MERFTKRGTLATKRGTYPKALYSLPFGKTLVFIGLSSLQNP
jgi:hypothetical protein